MHSPPNEDVDNSDPNPVSHDDLLASDDFPIPAVSFPVSRSITCLICGDFFNLLVDEDGNLIPVKEELLPPETGGPTAFDQIQADAEELSCLDCGSTRLNRRTPHDQTEWDDMTREVRLFESFLKAVKIKKYKMKYGWNFEEESVPFCASCKSQVSSLSQLLLELEELENRIGTVVRNVKEKMACSESNFQLNEVYKADKRYYWVRVSVLGSDKVKIGLEREKRSCKPKQEVPPRRSRRSNQVQPNANVEAPLVMISHEDKFKADKYVKVEPGAENAVHIASQPEEILNSTIPSSFTYFPDSDGEPADNSFAQFDDEIPSKHSTRKIKVKRKNPRSSADSSMKRKRSNKAKIEAKGLELGDQSEECGQPSKRIRRKRKVFNYSEVADDEIKEKKCDEYEPLSGTDDDEVDEEFQEDDTDDDDFQEEGKHRGKGRRKRHFRFNETKRHYKYDGLNFKALEDNLIKCAKCDILAASEMAMRYHYHREHKKDIKCSTCGFIAGSMGSLGRHKQLNHGSTEQTQVFCDICMKPFPRRSPLRLHRLTHFSAEEKAEAEAKGELDFLKEQGKHQCVHCGRTFRRRHNLLVHERKAHVNKEKPVPSTKESENEKVVCPNCGKISSNMETFKRHFKVVHPDLSDWRSRPFACVHCDRRFTSRKEFMRHKIIHSGNRPHKCTMCSREFEFEKKLKEHMNFHLNIRPYKCTASDCPAAFVTKIGLRRHFKTYHAPGSNPKRKCFQRGPDQGPFRISSQAVNAYRGESQLSEKRTRKCPECPMAFQYPSQLKRHLISYHGAAVEVKPT